MNDYKNNREYSEELLSGGKLVVRANDWFIHYYFPGIDLRYNGTFVDVKGSLIDKYIEAWKNNFRKYLELKNAIPDNGNFETKGEMDMSIRIGFAEGVCIRSFHLPIRDKEKLDLLISDYEYCKGKAQAIQQAIF